MLRTPTAARPGSQAINVEVSVVNHPDQSPHAFNPKLKRLQLIIQIIGENEQKE
ncbi:hypothetical protein HYV43_01920 [Candidatus Micrarchaeota archaeon]|nr:hypothetical protein [Candidatus Micrarchaeota archaeon]